MKLTANATGALALPDGKTDHIEWDDELPRFGFRLRRGAGGRLLRSWIVQYTRGDRSPRIKLGSAEVLGAAQARAAAKEILAQVALKKDPASDKRDRVEKDKLTFRAIAAEHLSAKQSDWAARTAVEAGRYLSDPKYFGPLHRMPLDTISVKDVASSVVRIQRECGKPTASRARSALAGLFTWAMRMGYTTANPTIGS